MISDLKIKPLPPSADELDYHQHGIERVAAFRAHLPPGAPALGTCEEGPNGEFCRVTQYNWATHDWSAAHRGDVEAVRNVAYCLSTGCDGAIFPNRVQGCAWRLVVVASGAAVVDESDGRNAREACGDLDGGSRIAAANRAAELAKWMPHLHGAD